MSALNFQKQFAPLVKSGKKRQTIRAIRKHPIKVGERLYLFTGMRTKACRNLRTAICRKVCAMEMTANSIKIDGVLMSRMEFDDFARDDGFNDWHGMRAWFQRAHDFPFTGQIILWVKNMQPTIQHLPLKNSGFEIPNYQFRD